MAWRIEGEFSVKASASEFLENVAQGLDQHGSLLVWKLSCLQGLQEHAELGAPSRPLLLLL